MSNSLSSRRIWLLGLLLVLGMAGGLLISWGGYGASASPVFNPLGLFGAYETERSDGGYTVLIDEQGTVLDETARRIYTGDEYIAENNNRYRVKSIDGDVARCVFVGVEEMADLPVLDLSVPAAAQTRAKPLVGIYHTHGGESYVPSQGVENVRGKGGITDVAATLASKLNSMGISAVHNDTSHAPNDSGAYRRSRRTAADLMKQGCRVLIDVHRDAAPASAYLTDISGKQVAKIKMVVGRQNPQKSTALGLAKQIKAQLDKNYPGLSKGIHIGRGGYNQDLSPTTMLVEVGSQRTTLEQAKAGANLFADIVPRITGLDTNAPAGATRVRTGTDEGGSWKSIGWILGAFIIGGIGYLLISTGSFKAAMGKVKQFGGSEWSSFFGRGERRRSGRPEDRDPDQKE